MSASSSAPSTVRRRPVPAPDAYTTAGAVIGLGCTLVGAYVQTPWQPGADGWGFHFGSNGGWATLTAVVAFPAVALVLVGMASARARALDDPARTARRALVLAGLGAVALVVFWTGAPAVLAGGAAGVALDARHRLGRYPAPAGTALAVAALTVAAAIYLAFTG